MKTMNKATDHTKMIWREAYSEAHDCWYIHAGGDTIACFYGRDSRKDAAYACIAMRQAQMGLNR